MAVVSWSDLKDCYRRPAESIPQLLKAMKKRQPKALREAAESEFWCSINDDQTLCAATAPGIDAYLGLIEAGEIALDTAAVWALTSVLADASAVSARDSGATLAIKSEVRKVIRKRRKFFERAYTTNVDLNVRTEIAELLAALGSPSQRFGVLAPRVRELLDHRDNPEMWSVLAWLDSRSSEIVDWEDHLRTILRDGANSLRFQAACYLMKYCDDPSAETIAALRTLPLHAEDSTCVSAFCAVAAFLPMDLLLMVTEDVFAGITNVLLADELCSKFLVAIFQPNGGYTGFAMDSGEGQIEFVRMPKRRYAQSRKLTKKERKRLCMILANCEALWFDRLRNRAVKTNLWWLFRLPAERVQMHQVAAP